MEPSPMVRARICVHRVQMGLSIAEAARRAGIHPAVWEGIESGSEPLTGELLSCFAQLLDVSVQYLLLGFDKIIYVQSGRGRQKPPLHQKNTGRMRLFKRFFKRKKAKL